MLAFHMLMLCFSRVFFLCLHFFVVISSSGIKLIISFSDTPIVEKTTTHNQGERDMKP